MSVYIYPSVLQNQSYKNTYENVSGPQPAISVNILGPRSRAGLMAYPQFKPKAIPITATRKPTLIAVTPLEGFMFLGSDIANIQISSNAVANTCKKGIHDQR